MRNLNILSKCKVLIQFKHVSQMTCLSTSARLFSKNVGFTVDDSDGIATLTMSKSPVNSFSLEFLQELNSSLKEVESSKAHGLVVTSSLPSIFSAGLDIMEMYQPKEDRLREFWKTFQELWINLNKFPIPVVSAITGHAPAAGCLIPLVSDYRVMVDDRSTIGLNESLLGIVAPFWLKDSMVYVIGKRQTDLSLQLGTLYSAKQALRLGLVDETGTSKEEVLEKAKQQVAAFMKISPKARQTSKMLLRASLVDNLVRCREDDINIFVQLITQPLTQKNLEMYINALKAKSKK